MKSIRVTLCLLILGSVVAIVPPCHADSQLDALVKRIQTRSASLKSLRGTVKLYQQQGGDVVTTSGSFVLKKPNLALIRIEGKLSNITVSADSKRVITLTGLDTFVKQPASSRGSRISPLWAVPIDLFFDPRQVITQAFGDISASQQKVAASYAGREVYRSTPYDVIHLQRDNYDASLFVTPSGIVTRFIMAAPYHLGAEFLEFTENTPVLPVDLAFELPKQAKPYKAPNYSANLVPVGKRAEKFDLVGLNQDRITFDSASAGKRAVLVNFWFYG